MRRTVGFAAVASLMIAATGLAGCQKKPEAAASDSISSRFVGVGIYSPQEPWTKMVAADQAKDHGAAKTIDDQAIIVVVDSKTGELRACGDLTGYCVGMNPWKKPLASSQVVPIVLSEHVKPSEPAVASAKITIKPNDGPKAPDKSVTGGSKPVAR